MTDEKNPSTDTNGEVHKEDLLEFTELDLLNINEIEDIAQDRDRYLEFVEKHRENHHSLLIFSLTHESFPEKEAKRLWHFILTHKMDLAKQLGRDVGITVATLDYMTNIWSLLEEPKIIEEEKSDQISEIATTDLLTGLYMRDVFEVSLEKTLNEAKRFGTSVCLAIIDIDDFKQVNDTLGHQVGDDVLMAIGNIISDNVREMDTAARYGGEELAVIMSRTDIDAAWGVAERIRIRIEEQDIAGTRVTVSIGLCRNHEGVKNPAAMVKIADDALCRAKRLGKNRTEKAPFNF